MKKSKRQLMELDHKAKAAAEKAMLIQRKRPRKQPRSRPRGYGREVRLTQQDWGKGQSKMAKKRRRQREQNGRQQPQPRPTGPPKKKASHKDKICDICHEKGHIKYNCPKRTSQQPKNAKKEQGAQAPLMLAASPEVKLMTASMDTQLIAESIGTEADQVVQAEPTSPAVEG